MKNDGKNLESVLQERRLFVPSPQFVAQAQLKADELQRLRHEAATDNQAFWADQARKELIWQRPFTRVLDESRAPNFEWFADGKLNVAYNCLDVHLRERGHKTALIFEGEPGDSRRLSYQELHAQVCRAANALRDLGVQSGDRVVIYMPLVPEAIIAMFACARIGAVHSVVFGGFSALSLRERIEDAGARVLLTADGGNRAGNIIEWKAAADEALSQGCPSIEKVVVLKRTGIAVPMVKNRDIWWHEAIEGQSPVCEPQWVDAEHPLYLLYTSGSTGRPKGIQHSSAGYLLGVKLSTRWVLDLREDDVYWCTADVGWVTGHSYVAYGPLALGATVVMYEGAPTWPNAGRWWHICQKHGVTIFYTAPTALRALMKLGDEIPAGHDLSRLRLLGSVGEPINPKAWLWYHTVIGGERCPIVDTWWQTETGSIMITPLPGIVSAKPGSATRPFPGVSAEVVDERDGQPIGSGQGLLVLKRPWPSMLRTLYKEDDRFVETYFSRFGKETYLVGDAARKDKDGYFWIIGRIDDVVNVSGHRLSTAEVESAIVSHGKVAESAVIGQADEDTGQAICAFVTLEGDLAGTDELVDEIRTHVGERIGKFARPKRIIWADDLPKTRSGKIMRRLLRDIADGRALGDVTTLRLSLIH